MQAFSDCTSDFIPLVNLLGLYFQIRDDYINLVDTDYMEHKSYCEDLTEGKFSFPLIYGIQKDPSDHRLLSILKQRTTNRSVKEHAVKYLAETGAFEYTKAYLETLYAEILGEIAALGTSDSYHDPTDHTRMRWRRWQRDARWACAEASRDTDHGLVAATSVIASCYPTIISTRFLFTRCSCRCMGYRRPYDGARPERAHWRLAAATCCATDPTTVIFSGRHGAADGWDDVWTPRSRRGIVLGATGGWRYKRYRAVWAALNAAWRASVGAASTSARDNGGLDGARGVGVSSSWTEASRWSRYLSSRLSIAKGSMLSVVAPSGRSPALAGGRRWLCMRSRLDEVKAVTRRGCRVSVNGVQSTWVGSGLVTRMESVAAKGFATAWHDGRRCSRSDGTGVSFGATDVSGPSCSWSRKRCSTPSAAQSASSGATMTTERLAAVTRRWTLSMSTPALTKRSVVTGANRWLMAWYMARHCTASRRTWTIPSRQSTAYMTMLWTHCHPV